ncbi:hypothetical protein [Fretibacterium fastidiosum]|uniref:Uncharacterized protein n=1 Tax=Fretibacterium fastidiosum TaxID=651822 RepID=A0AB94IWU5_9BACT|nr:hypothetical protein [Fretibacterium fastidiosum]CBL28235.1 hypothetical protein SY1_09960 [Fretibacterium fastidiosum]
MEKIRLGELNKALRQCGIGLDLDEIDNTPCFGVYHVHDWNHGYDGFYGITVYEDGSYTKGTAGFHGTRRQFYRDMQETINFLLEYFRFKKIQELIIAPCFQYTQFSFNAERNDIYEEIYAFLRKNNVRKNERSGVKINLKDDIGPLEMTVEGAFRGVSELCLFAPTHKMLIAPNHHFGFTFFTQQKSLEMEVITELLGGYLNLLYLEDQESQ